MRKITARRNVGFLGDENEETFGNHLFSPARRETPEKDILS